MRSQSLTLVAMGFSQRDVLAGFGPADDELSVQAVGQNDVNDLDVGILRELVVGLVVVEAAWSGMPYWAAILRALSRVSTDESGDAAVLALGRMLGRIWLRARVPRPTMAKPVRCDGASKGPGVFSSASEEA